MLPFTRKRLETLRAIADDRVTWRNQSFRQWGNSDPLDNEDTYVLVTAQAAWLVKCGYAVKRMSHGYSFTTSGYVEITPKGRKVLSGPEKPASSESALDASAQEAQRRWNQWARIRPNVVGEHLPKTTDSQVSHG